MPRIDASSNVTDAGASSRSARRSAALYDPRRRLPAMPRITVTKGTLAGRSWSRDPRHEPLSPCAVGGHVFDFARLRLAARAAARRLRSTRERGRLGRGRKLAFGRGMRLSQREDRDVGAAERDAEHVEERAERTVEL